MEVAFGEDIPQILLLRTIIPLFYIEFDLIVICFYASFWLYRISHKMMYATSKNLPFLEFALSSQISP
jgi:hypothetical protein